MFLRYCAFAILCFATLALNNNAAADTNAKLFLIKYKWGEAVPSFTSAGQYKDWSKDYHEVVALRNNQVGFYRRTDGFFRVMFFSEDGSFHNVISTKIGKHYDDIIVGDFVGDASQPDILLFSRKTQNVLIYQYDSITPKLTLHTRIKVAKTKNGGSFDLVASGYLGHTEGKHDIFFYNKTEGSARVYRMDGNRLVSQKSFGGMARNWDAIIPADIDGDAYTDFAFYNQDGGGGVGTEDIFDSTNPLNGTVKMMSLGNNHTWKVLNEYHDSWPMHANVQIIPGEFGGDNRTDFLIYQGEPDGKSVATMWINNNGAYSAFPPITNWQGRWTNIVPLGIQNLGGGSDLFFYTRQVEVPILLVIDNDGGGPSGVTATADEIRTDFENMMPLVNSAFAPAGVHFSINPNTLTFDFDDVRLSGTGVGNGMDATPIQRPNSNSLTCYNPAAADTLNNYAKQLRRTYPNHLVAYVKRASRSPSCGSDEFDFIVMAQPRNTASTTLMRDGSSTPIFYNPKLLAHELGHFFSLIHTQTDSYFDGEAAKDRYVFSDDDANVWDTPPNPHTGTTGPNGEPSPWTAVGNFCDDSGANDLSIEGQDYTLNPERHEIMSRGINCDFVYRVTPDQASAIHTNRLQRDWVNQK